jgi:hypothetical protein
VFGLPPLPASVQARRSKQMYLGSKPSSDHLKIAIDAKMRLVQEVLGELFRFVEVLPQVLPPPGVLASHALVRSISTGTR